MAVYALVALAVVIASRMQVAAGGAGAGARLPPVATDRDPYEIAYLRGGSNELLRFTIFDLIRQGYLRLCDPPKPGQAPEKIVQTGEPPAAGLSSLQQSALAFYAEPKTTAELFASPLRSEAEAYGAQALTPKLTAEGFFSSPDDAANATLVRLYGALALSVLAAYRFFTALVKHHNNVIFLAILTVVALVVLLLATRVPRLSGRGRAYLERLATALRPVPVASVAGAGPAAAGIGVLPVLVAATGISALAGTEFAPMQQMFPQRTERASSSNCSGGCGSGSSSSSSGSSCGSGSGCGGGCGG